MEWYLVPGIGVAVFVVVGFLAYLYEKKRTEKWRHAALTMGFSFAPKGDSTFLSRLETLDLFSQGRSRKVRNLLQRTVRDAEVSIFDYRYTVGSGDSSSTHNQTVIYFRSEKLRLPGFSLRPENIFHRIGSAFGYQDIDFEHSPEFSRQYLLRGKDEEAIRAIFDRSVLGFYQNQKLLCTEGAGDQLLVYRHVKRVKTEDLPAYLGEGMRIFELFRST